MSFNFNDFSDCIIYTTYPSDLKWLENPWLIVEYSDGQRLEMPASLLLTEYQTRFIDFITDNLIYHIISYCTPN